MFGPDRDWLQSLQVGDMVAIPLNYGNNGHLIEMVTRTTATQVIVGMRRYRRKNGDQVGSRWSSAIHPVTDEIRATNHRLRLLRRINACDWSKATDETLAAVAELLPAIEPGTSGK